MRCLKNQVKDAEIHYLTKPAFASILENNKYVNQVHVLDKPVLAKAIELKQLGFDYVIDLHNNLRSQFFKTIIGAPSFSFDKLNIEKSILVNFKTNMLPQVHIVDRYLDTLKNFDIKNDGLGLDYFFSTNFCFNKQITLPINYTAFGIGAQHSTKRLPNSKIVDICNQIKHPIILLGGKEDASNGDFIAQQNNDNVINLCGKLSLQESAFVIKNCKQIITHDTGLMHIAAALKKPIISVWGNTVPQLGMTPYYGEINMMSTTFEVDNLSCRPCSKIGFKACPKKHFNCMMQQDTEAIARAVKI